MVYGRTAFSKASRPQWINDVWQILSVNQSAGEYTMALDYVLLPGLERNHQLDVQQAFTTMILKYTITDHSKRNRLLFLFPKAQTRFLA